MALKSIGLKILVMVAGLALMSACETAVEKKMMKDDGGAKKGDTMKKETMKGVVPGSQEDLVLNVGDRIFYDYDRSDVRPDQRKQVENWAAWLKKYPSVTVTLEGHADERGTREYNLGLGDRRANSAKRMLEALGIASSRVNIISFGKERPVCEASTDGCYSQNRRGVLVVN